MTDRCEVTGKPVGENAENRGWQCGCAAHRRHPEAAKLADAKRVQDWVGPAEGVKP